MNMGVNQLHGRPDLMENQCQATECQATECQVIIRLKTSKTQDIKDSRHQRLKTSKTQDKTDSQITDKTVTQ
jgi:hypothetical protein